MESLDSSELSMSIPQVDTMPHCVRIHYKFIGNGKNVKLPLYLITLLITMPWRYMGERRYSSTIRDLCTRWRWVVSFSPLTFNARRGTTHYSLDRRLGGPQEPVWNPWTRRKHLVFFGNWDTIAQLVAHALYWLSYLRYLSVNMLRFRIFGITGYIWGLMW
jgi:hypothetical protein